MRNSSALPKETLGLGALTRGRQSKSFGLADRRATTTAWQKNVSPVPQIIHQSWRTKRLENFQREWQKSWLQNHPGWTYMFWTDKDNRRLIAEHFPWFLDIYTSFPRNIQRADCARYFYMIRFGGCYVDLDFESLKTISPLLQNVEVALAYMTKDINSDLSIPNAFLASVPGHDFWWYVIKQVLTAVAAGNIDPGDAHRTTGPVMLKNAVKQFWQSSRKQELTVFPAETLYSVDYNWREDPGMRSLFTVCHAASQSFNSTKCKSFFPKAYAVTYWSGDITWMAE